MKTTINHIPLINDEKIDIFIVLDISGSMDLTCNKVAKKNEFGGWISSIRLT
jgi:hypothetical protein